MVKQLKAKHTAFLTTGCLFAAAVVALIILSTKPVQAAAAAAPGCPCYQMEQEIEIERELTATEPAIKGDDVIQVQKTPPPPGEVSIVVDTYRRKLTVMSDGEPYKQYPVATGKYKTPTPIGNFKVLRKAAHWGSGFGTRWIGLTVPWGTYGIHGTNNPGAIGSYASHGCIRMNNHNVEEIYPWIKPGTPVTLIGNPFRYQPSQYRMLRRDARGSDVMEVQLRLQRLGYYTGPIDGIWGGGMEKAVLQFRESKGLAKDNVVDYAAYQALGLQ